MLTFYVTIKFVKWKVDTMQSHRRKYIIGPILGLLVASFTTPAAHAQPSEAIVNVAVGADCRPTVDATPVSLVDQLRFKISQTSATCEFVFAAGSLPKMKLKGGASDYPSAADSSKAEFVTTKAPRSDAALEFTIKVRKAGATNDNGILEKGSIDLKN